MSPTSLQDVGLRDYARDLIEASELIDLHVDGMIPHRLLGYDLNTKHEKYWLRGRLFGHLDFPRAFEQGLSGAMWSITTNPIWPKKIRFRFFLDNLKRLRQQVDNSDGRVAWVTNYSDYMKARTRGEHACMPAIQGGNALTAAPSGAASIPGDAITRVTLLHLTNSSFGITSSPFSGLKSELGLGDSGADFIRDLNRNRIFVDLAHINRPGFWDAVKYHDPDLPILVTHTGVAAVNPSWRNLDDMQIRAVADSGGTMGIIFSEFFLNRSGGPRDGGMVVEHMEHIIQVVGEDFVSVGSDYDGFIIPPDGLRGKPDYTHLVMCMLKAGFSESRIQKILGLNFLRCFQRMRPD